MRDYSEMSTMEAILLGGGSFLLFMILVGGVLYGFTFIAAWIRDLRGLPPDTPDLSDLDTRRPNVQLWLRRIKDDPYDAAHHMGRIVRWVPRILLGLVVLAGLIWGVIAIGGTLASAPGWALVMFAIVIVVLLSRR